MPRLIVTCKYYDQKSKSVEGLVQYIGTRESVALNDDMQAMVGYIGERPGVEKVGKHGLFNGSDDPIDMKKAKHEFATHDGRVYSFVISMTREDAERLGYNSQLAWKNMLRSQTPNIAQTMGISLERFRWISAFHNTAHHPHVHFLCYDTENKGYLKDIDSIRSSIAKEIFHDELMTVYSEATRLRDDLRKYSREYMEQLSKSIDNKLPSSKIALMLTELSARLKTVSGKKQYGFLPKEIKALVNDIVRELSDVPEIAEMYRGWCAAQNAIQQTYKNNLENPRPLWEQDAFKPIKNAVIQVAMLIPADGVYLYQKENYDAEKEESRKEKQAQTLQAEAAEESSRENSPSADSDVASDAAGEQEHEQTQLLPEAVKCAFVLTKYASNLIRAEHYAMSKNMPHNEHEMLVREAIKKLDQGQKLE